MAKQNNPRSPEDNYLTTPVEVFKGKLKVQINEGISLVDKINHEAFTETFHTLFKEWNDYNFEYLKQSFKNPMNDQMDAYNHAGYSFMGALGEVTNNPAQSLINTIEYKLSALNSLLKRADLFKSAIATEEVTPHKTGRGAISNEVFIVHGHDEGAKASLARLLERLGLKPIILHEQSSSGRTIIEKIEAYTNVGFGVVLYTACDLGGKDVDSLENRARQNVVFEHGYLIGKIGRENVCALVKGDIETPGDISGVVYTSMDNQDAWHVTLAKELRAAGYKIDMNKL